MRKNNIELRTAMTANGIPAWKLATLDHVSENTMYRRLREELPEDEKKRLLDLIENAAKEGRTDA